MAELADHNLDEEVLKDVAGGTGPYRSQRMK